MIRIGFAWKRTHSQSVDKKTYETITKRAIRIFWSSRKLALERNQKGKKKDPGSRGGATGGKNLDGFLALIEKQLDFLKVPDLEISFKKALVTLPGHFRPSKQWDLVVMFHGRLLATVELKSLGGPSFGNNANNRCEEAIGSGVDFRTAQREGSFGSGAAPFLGYLILIHDAEGSRKAGTRSMINPSFKIDSCFASASYQERMAILCERMTQEGLYNAAAAMSSPANAARSGEFKDLSKNASFHRLLNHLIAHISAETSLA